MRGRCALIGPSAAWAKIETVVGLGWGSFLGILFLTSFLFAFLAPAFETVSFATGFAVFFDLASVAGFVEIFLATVFATAFCFFFFGAGFFVVFVPPFATDFFAFFAIAAFAAAFLAGAVAFLVFFLELVIIPSIKPGFGFYDKRERFMRGRAPSRRA